MATVSTTTFPKAKLNESVEEFENKVVKFRKRRKNILFDIREVELVNTEGKNLTGEDFTVKLKDKLLEATLELTTLGASVIQLVVSDPDGTLLNHPLFNEHWKIEYLKKETEKSSNKANEEIEEERVWALPEKSIDLNLEGLWFRLIGFQTQETQFTLTFEDRVAAILREERGKRITAKRGEVTRAQFIAKLVELAEKGKFGKNAGKIPFFSPEENVKQPIKKETAKEQEENAKLENRENQGELGQSSTSKGTVPSGLLNPNQTVEQPGELTEISESQAKVATELLEVVEQQGGNEIVAVSIILSGLLESNLGDSTTGAEGARGVLQGLTIKDASTKNEAFYFCKGGEGFQGGGAIALSKTITNPEEIVLKVEVYEKTALTERRNKEYLPAAKNIVKKYKANWPGTPVSSGTSKATSTTVPYEFTRGVNQNSWECMQHLAEEVGWYLFVRNNILFYCSGNYLLGQQTRFTLEAHKKDVYWTNVSVDLGSLDGIAEVEVTCHAEAHEAVPGEAVTIQNIGPASGTWVGMTATQNLLDAAHEVTSKFEKPNPLKQEKVRSENYEAPKEPGAEGTALAAFNAASELSEFQIPYVYGGGHGAGELAKVTKGFPGLDCSSSTSYVLHKAALGMSSTAEDSTALEIWGESGQGKEMTVWANASHAFIEFNVSGHQRAQLNTNVPGDPGPRLVTITSPTDTYNPSPSSEGYTARHWKGT
jgi:hypothetical protein